MAPSAPVFVSEEIAGGWERTARGRAGLRGLAAKSGISDIAEERGLWPGGKGTATSAGSKMARTRDK